jgi:hypothetical protein
LGGVELLEDQSQSATERLLASSWEARERRASQRELIVDATAAALFITAASALLWVGGLATLRPGTAALLIAVYALVGRIEFPVGAGYVVPTQLILIPMLVVAVTRGMARDRARDRPARGRIASHRLRLRAHVRQQAEPFRRAQPGRRGPAAHDARQAT